MKTGGIEYIGYKYYNNRQKTLDSIYGAIKGFLFYKITYYVVACVQIHGHTGENDLCQI